MKKNCLPRYIYPARSWVPSLVIMCFVLFRGADEKVRIRLRVFGIFLIIIDHCVHNCQCPVIIIKDVDKKGKEGGSGLEEQQKKQGEGSGHTPPLQVMPSSLAH